MMERFTLYSSGITTAHFTAEGSAILHEMRDPYSLAFSACAPMAATDDGAYAFYKVKPFFLLSQRAGFEAAAKQAPDAFSLGTMRYTRAEPTAKNTPLCYIQRGVKFPCNALFWEGKLIAWLCPCREQTNLLVREGFEDKTPLALWKDYADRPLYGVRGPETYHVVMRDGVELATDVYLPDGAAMPVPALLVRTPYDRDAGAQSYFRYVRRGYAVVVQDVRGRCDSGGEWLPHYYEVEDGDDTLTWVGAQDWCDGKIGTLGGSYLGYTQWCAAALGNPYLKAMVSVVTAGTAMLDSPMHGGCLGSGGFAWMFSMTKQRYAPERMVRDDWDEVLDIRPLEEIPQKALGEEVPFIRKTLEHPCEDEFWLRGNWVKRNVGKAVPVLIQSGWFDDNGMGTTEALDLTAGYPAGMRKVILGPWQHSGYLDLLYQHGFDLFLGGEENGI